MLRLLAAVRTNPQIGAELYISTSTTSVHVSNILRKLGVSSRVQAVAIAERAGLLNPPATLNTAYQLWRHPARSQADTTAIRGLSVAASGVPGR